MDGSQATRLTTPVASIPTIERRSLSTGWAAVLGLGWPAVVALCTAIEPAPADPDAAAPFWVTLAGFVLLGSMIAAGTLAWRRSVRAIGWAAVAGGVAMLLTVTCPLSGHHASVGLWWYTQFTACAAMIWATALARHQHQR